MLYLVSTPIGNLSDITIRAIDTLKSVDLILCEDTRKSHILLDRYEIATPLKSYHKFSERKREEEVISLLKEGKKIALISDAGTPGINDPGVRLVRRCRTEGLDVTSLPGPSAPITALTLSGLDTCRFQFLGFLPKREGKRKKLLINALFYPGLNVFFESPNRLGKTLSEIALLAPEHEIAIARELTKIHEECLWGKAGDFAGCSWRGELVVILEGNKSVKYSLSPKKHVTNLMEIFDLSKSEAIKLAAELRGISKKEVYTEIIDP